MKEKLKEIMNELYRCKQDILNRLEYVINKDELLFMTNITVTIEGIINMNKDVLDSNFIEKDSINNIINNNRKILDNINRYIKNNL